MNLHGEPRRVHEHHKTHRGGCVRCADAMQRTRSGLTASSGLAEHDDRSGGEHLRSSASPAADVVDDALEVLEIANADSHKRVWFTGEGERLDHLGEVGDGCVDVSDLRSGSEAKLDEGLDVLPQQAMIEGRRIPADDALAFEPVDASLRGWRRETDQSTDLARRATGVLDQSVEDRAIGLIECWSRGFQIVTQDGFRPFTLNDIEEIADVRLDPTHRAQPQSWLWR